MLAQCSAWHLAATTFLSVLVDFTNKQHFPFFMQNFNIFIISPIFNVVTILRLILKKHIYVKTYSPNIPLGEVVFF